MPLPHFGGRQTYLNRDQEKEINKLSEKLPGKYFVSLGVSWKKRSRLFIGFSDWHEMHDEYFRLLGSSTTSWFVEKQGNYIEKNYEKPREFEDFQSEHSIYIGEEYEEIRENIIKYFYELRAKKLRRILSD